MTQAYLEKRNPSLEIRNLISNGKKKFNKIKLVYASILGYLLYTSYPYPLEQSGLADVNSNFLSYDMTTNDSAQA